MLNHTSDQHEWFKKSRQAPPGSAWRDFYVWSDTNQRYGDARIIFKDFETSNWTWDPVAKAYFWHRFYSHQPDLNFENPKVHRALFKVIDFWLSMGVDGLRLDAVPYLYEKDGTNCENLPATFAFLTKLRAHVEQRFPGRMLLAEANQWPEDAVAYFGKGDMCHMAFHFPLMPRMFMALQMEDRFPIIDILEQTPAIPDTAQWAIFLRNHDELTLEMVSEEERDFMYRSYAREMSSRINLGIRRRLAPLLQNSRRRLELLNILLLSLPGTPVIYYGDEIGMGDNHYLGDRDGVRTPMQWSADRNAGFSLVNPQQLFLPVIIDPEYHYQTVNIENEERTLSSLLWWMRRAIAMRRSFQAFSRGSMQFVNSSNASVLSFVRKLGDEAILVVVNLSRFGQPVQLDLGAHAGSTPVDVFSGNRFPRISPAPYAMTLGFHDYFWLHLKADDHADPRVDSYSMPDFAVGTRWQDVFEGQGERRLSTEILPDYLQQRTTAGCRPKHIQSTTIVDRVPVKRGSFGAVMLLVKVRYVDGDIDLLFLPLTLETETQATAVIGEDKGLILGLANGGSAGVIYDCTYHPVLQALLLDAVESKRHIRGLHGVIVGEPNALRDAGALAEPLSVQLTRAGRRNSCLVIGDKVFVKVFRRLEEGSNPDIELQRKLSGQTTDMVAGFVGCCTYRSAGNVSYHLGLYTDYFAHSKTFWRTALDAVSQHLESAMAGSIDHASAAPPVSSPESGSILSATPMGLLFERKVRLIGELTARMHRELATGDGEDFRVEPFTMLYQRSLYQSFRGFTHRVFSRIAEGLDALSDSHSAQLKALLPREKEIFANLTSVLRTRVSAVRMRIHGDFHLGQIMVMDEKYRICDFEGVPTLPLSERRLKRSPLRDVASLMHSLHYAAQFSLIKNVKIQEKDRQVLLPTAQLWAATMSEAFLLAYLAAMEGTTIIASALVETRALVRLYLFERALSDVEKALEFDHDHIPIAARCLLHALGEATRIAHA